ncbi:MAG: SprT family zinc-dependent metalloprotease [bacterium]
MPKTATAEISYSIRRSSRARRLTATVYPDARIVITAPPAASGRKIADFVSRYMDWIERQLAGCRKNAGCTYLPGGRRDYLKHRERARTLVHETLERLNRAYGFRYGRVSIKNLYARWGSCSELGNLNFNYKLVHLPSHLAEYIIVHELCHLGEMNHSARFWSLVARIVPDWRDCRRELRRYVM